MNPSLCRTCLVRGKNKREKGDKGINKKDFENYRCSIEDKSKGNDPNTDFKFLKKTLNELEHPYQLIQYEKDSFFFFLLFPSSIFLV